MHENVLKSLPIGIIKIEMNSNIIEFYNDEALMLVRGNEKEYCDTDKLLSQFCIEHNLTKDIKEHNIIIKNFDITLNVLSKPLLMIPQYGVCIFISKLSIPPSS